MSTATKTYVIANGTPLDASQVERDFVDVLAFINGSLPHSDGTGGAADPRGLVFLKDADKGKKVLFGGPTDVAATNGQDETDTTISFGATFGTVPSVIAVLGTVHPSNPVTWRIKSRTTTNFVLSIEKADGSAFGGNATYNVFWVASG